LDGSWLFHPVPEELIDVNEAERTQRYSQSDLVDASWETVTVPGYWDQPPGEWPWSNPTVPGGPYPGFDGEAWYRLHFNVPPETLPSPVGPPGENAFTAYLEFGAVSAYAAVWLNGEFVGRHVGAYAPFALNVSKKLLPSSTNVIAIRVFDKTVYHNPDAENPNATTEIPLGFDSRAGGLWQSVRLRIGPKEHILDFTLETSLDSLSLDVLVSDEAVGSSTLSVTVNDRSTGKALYGPRREPVVAFPGHPSGIRLNLQPLQPRYWSPEDPHRYELVLELRNRKGEMDRRIFDFGFKTFEVKAGKIHLNGAPYFLFGAGSPPHYENPSVEVARIHLTRLKEAGVRVVRFAHEPPAEFWLDLCDEIGLLAWAEGPLWAGNGPYDFANRAFVNQATAETIDLLRSLGNHPSLAIWSIGSGNCRAHRTPEGRQTASAVLERMTSRLNQSDLSPLRSPDSASGEVPIGPTQRIVLPDSDNRLLVSSPLEDWTTDLGWYRGKTGDWGPFLDAVAANREGTNAPWVTSQIETGYSTAGQGSILSIPSEEAASRMRIGTPGDERAELLAYQSERIKSMIEKARAKRDPNKNRISGVFPFTSNNWFFNPLTPSAIAPKPILQAISEAYRPVILAIDLPKLHYFAGEVLLATVTIVNDSPKVDQSVSGLLTLEALGLGEQFRASSQLEIQSVTAYSSVPFTLPVSLPDVPRIRPAQVQARLTAGDSEIARNGARIWIGNVEFCRSAAADLAEDVLAYDPDSQLSALFQQAGRSPVQIQALADLKKAAGFIVGPGGFDDFMARGWPAISHWVSGGARVLILEQTPAEDRWHFSGPYPGNYRLIEPKGWMGGVDRINLRVPDHAVFAGLQAENLRNWGGNRILCRRLLDPIPDSPSEDTRVLADVIPSSEKVEWKAAVSEVRIGEGIVLLCQLSVVDKAMTDPMASLFWRNLLRWVGGAKRPILSSGPLPAESFTASLVGDLRGEITADFSGSVDLEPILPVPVADGPFEATACSDLATQTTHSGLLPKRSESGGEKVYFDVDDRFWLDSPGAVEVEALVYALEPGEVRIDYDSADDSLGSGAAYKPTAPFPVLETGAWKVLLFKIPDARFGGRQPDSCDFRLVAVKGRIVFGPLAMRKIDSGNPQK
jgi:hypothetical protein